MPVTYVIDATKNLIRTTCSSPITLADVVHHFKELNDDPTCRGHFDVLLDVREVDSLPESGQLRVVNAEIATTRSNVEFGACAIVANRDALFGMMRMFAVFAETKFRSISVFRNADKAEAWLASQSTGDDRNTF